MIRRLALVAALLSAACSDLGTDPNAVVALSFPGAAYPSIVAGDSLRDSTGALLPLRATGLNYKGNAVAGAQLLFSSPDTVLRLFDNGVVFARARKPDGTPVRVFATIGSLQAADTFPVVVRADSVAPGKAQDTISVSTSGEGTTVENTINFSVFGDTAAGKPKIAVPGWLVSFQFRYRGTLIPPSDTSRAYTYIFIRGTSTTNPSRLIPTFVDTTDGSGRVGRGVALRKMSTASAEDTIFLVATARQRKTGTPPITAETMFIVRRQ
jgi:hypothetical protein